MSCSEHSIRQFDICAWLFSFAVTGTVLLNILLITATDRALACIILVFWYSLMAHPSSRTSRSIWLPCLRAPSLWIPLWLPYTPYWILCLSARFNLVSLIILPLAFIVVLHSYVASRTLHSICSCTRTGWATVACTCLWEVLCKPCLEATGCLRRLCPCSCCCMCMEVAHWSGQPHQCHPPTVLRGTSLSRQFHAVDGETTKSGERLL